MNLRIDDISGSVCSACLSLEPHLNGASGSVLIGYRGVGTH